ncbi:glucose-6-phosphate isomerase [Candidatus Thioglobus sp.]|jgi:glucose-6-phosphate isomerase|uniref:glucose-6-phosphate isomerase n=1 Tax=Candidatus Thioglobus sp. TaxID=2026721 RepID=UPI0025C29B7B|nr:glucose-6-phosphate isomerase [Candidatus Thioglobus sp.]MBT3277738.1 glucose-6-phosphate isomerase [Candidatus Thioglobus sp.]MBT3447249.1 glucose-6-phosphate isomerase [Candidatus Thioglobus sp.]MBT4001379.1 glucose-6-phosphate isomerase [Candidatus Thioglobus sp.]MBT7295902.1 glucose-6-phosphate isomerase [Candidatus Thioglobus sp.]
MEYSKNFYQIKSNSEIFDRINAEREEIGYYNLPYQDTAEIKDYAQSINKKHIVVLGIGGSSLGARAIYEFLLSSNNYTKDLLFLETIDPLKIKLCLKKVDLNDAQFVVISKSGNTIETLSLFKYLNSLVEINSTNCTIISETKSNLTQFANDNNIKSFDLAEDIGGRFSVFSVVGLVPLAMVGVDIDNLLNGCKRVADSFFEQTSYYKPIIRKARFLVENKNRFNINVVFSYSSLLESFNKWYVQLWAESLGKININGTRQALTPVGLVGPVDQHSFLQMIMDGVRDKTVTFIKINDLKDSSSIPKDTANKFDGLACGYAEGYSFNDLLNMQADATIQSIEEQDDIPCDVISIRTVDEYNIAKIMFSYQLLVSCIGAFLQINTYDQPGVEYGKINLAEKFQR